LDIGIDKDDEKDKIDKVDKANTAKRKSGPASQ